MSPKYEEAAIQVETAADQTDYRALLAVLRPSEWVIVCFFLFTALQSLAYEVTDARRALAFAGPLAYYALGYADSLRPRFWLSIVRDWIPSSLILVAYWQVDWFYQPGRLTEIERIWLDWDRVMLYGWGLRGAVEIFGAFVPAVLETCYALLYVIPPFCVASLYVLRRRDLVDRFQFTFMLGTLLAYASLPHFPTASPRVEFPGLDLPTYLTAVRRFNIWLLNHGDIQASVFPSGHVATAFSAAFSMMLAVPERKWLVRGLVAMALAISTATIYGRYHYATDVLAGFALSLVAVAVTLVLRKD